MSVNIKPSREEFVKMSERANLIALSTEINMDMDTPVSVYAKLVEGSRGYTSKHSGVSPRQPTITSTPMNASGITALIRLILSAKS